MLALQTQNLNKIFHKGKSNEFVALSDISLSIKKGSCTLLKGSSGSGKTTLISILAGLTKPTSGSYICLEENVSHWSEKFLTQFRREHIGIVFQHFNLIQGLTVEQNIILPLLPLNYSIKKMESMSKEAATLAHISHKLNQKIDTLSGGELQRTAIARALIRKPAILFADEPTSHLDRKNAVEVFEVFEKLKENGQTIILTTHDEWLKNHSIIDNVIELNDGKLVENK
ncbi:ABC-type antimicrobial peptide transport system, ATPase component [Bernardetia litoralis DSM 6794]|uniref:ABC-type antimicrobial peptide transport system, ATPase component n=1 Tax=Bernardetia litoralis (strain ATCC 23117 / DSM 6794 / NBRC 15988 / NCIMB 1366 / Fx l1 / Sio-4) TaxID=880071 RepID=I4AMH1_BERLS|nr:ABC transporter ATP-binding protein [Bernardetia litoralis]AFM05156.1 ABC-type antimicrobial peptide transport system, ATPase component [Bernardetia litoralis DSM 6794]